MTIRDFRPEDWADYHRFSLDFYSGGATLHPISEENLQNTFREGCKASPLMRGLMLEDEAATGPVGYALLSFTWSNEAGGLTVLLEEFYVAPAHRGAGHGKGFLEWLFAAYKDAKRIRLEVCEENTSARLLYERSGFELLPYLQMIKEQ